MNTKENRAARLSSPITDTFAKLGEINLDEVPDLHRYLSWVPDPRGRCGRWYSLSSLLALCAAAVVIGSVTVEAIASGPRTLPPRSWPRSASAALIAKELGLPVRVLDELSEVDHGQWSGLTQEEIASRWPGECAAREHDRYGYRFLGGESYADADLRAGRALDAVAASGSLRPLLVSHEMIGRMLLKHLCRMSSDEALRTSQPHDIVYRISASRTVERLS